MENLAKRLNTHEGKDDRRHAENLKRFRAVHTSLVKISTKLADIESNMAKSSDVKEVVEVFKTAKVGWSIFRVSWRTILLIGIVASGGLSLIGGWRNVVTYFTGFKL